MHEFDFIQQRLNRRTFLRTSIGGASLGLCMASLAEDPKRSFHGVVGITTGGGVGEQRRRGELKLLDLPKYVRNELGMTVIDLNTRWIKSSAPRDLMKVRDIATAVGCQFSNLKVNHKFGELYSHNPKEQQAALTAAQRLIDAAHILGTRWIRFTIRASEAKSPKAHRQLAEYAKPKGIQLLIENGSRQKDPRAVASTVKAIGVNVAPCPDTGNWADSTRMEGLRQTFPGAASCDFKVYELNADRSHPKYDLKQCFDIGWQAGFRGPWIIEHMKPTTSGFAKDTVYIREMLAGWIKTASKK
ncbi:MAG: hypothetical protein CMJ78_27155 [Planctomycetaceae bacterium]|nr:hypothetical protein [Planctomycetaceae bacterium]